MRMRAAQMVALGAMADLACGQCSVERTRDLVAIAAETERVVDASIWPDGAGKGRSER
jgi:hypothetical protein